MRPEFHGSFLKQVKVTYNHWPIVSIYIVYKLICSINTSSATFENCLFGAVKLTNNNDIDKCKYSGYEIGFDSRRTFSHRSGRFGKNVIIFGADISSFIHANNKTKNILVLGEGFTRQYNTLCRQNVFS